MLKRSIVVGSMLFCIFFGASNLIFPVKIGWMSGDFFWYAMVGFLITSVGMPLCGIIASSFFDGGIPELLNKKVSPVFSLIFMSAIYLTIGPLFAIPRTATTSYEIGLVPFIGHSSWLLFIFTALYFLIVLYSCLKPSKVIDILGKYLTPLILFFLAVLFFLALFYLTTRVGGLHDTLHDKNPFIGGLLEGYNTMDVIASTAFAILAIGSLKNCGISKEKGLTKYCCYAAIVCSIFSTVVFLVLAWIGNHHPIAQTTLTALYDQKLNIGAYILSNSANLVLGNLGPFLMSTLVFLACITTAIGLIIAVAGYFYRVFPKIKYEYYVIVFTLVSFILSNQGLEQVIKSSVPTLMVLYPIAIVAIAAILIDQLLLPLTKIAYSLVVYLTAIVSLLMIFSPPTLAFLPLGPNFSWLTPAVAALLIGVIIERIIIKPNK